MSNKHLSIIAAQNTDYPAETHNAGAKNKLDLFVESLLKTDRQQSGTIEAILNHAQVKKHGILGRLSASQQSLITSVVSLMQDKVAQDAKQNADALKQIILVEREALASMSKSFAATAKSLYRLPLISAARSEREKVALDHRDENYTSATHYGPQAVGGGAGENITPPLWQRLFTWGNLVAVTAILMAVLVLKTSVDTANYEAKYHLTQENLDQLKTEWQKLQTAQQQLNSENKYLAEQNAALNSRLVETDKQQGDIKNRYETELQQSKQSLQDAQQTIAKLQTSLEQAQTVNTSVKQSLNGEINALQQELAGLKGKESQQSESYNMWKNLAEERKEQLSKLQNELSERENKAVSEKDKAKFLGIF